MTDLSSLAGDMQGVEQTAERDSLGGGGPLDSQVMDARIEVAYMSKSKGGATGFNTVLVGPNGEKVVDRQWITSGTKKGCKPYYEKDGKRFPLPGFSHVDFMVDLLLGKSLTQLQQQAAVIKLWNSEKKAEEPTEVTAMPELRGLKVKVGIKKVRQNKMTGDNYNIPTNEEQVFNEVDKYFDFETGKTKTELKANSDAEFIQKWKEKWEGEVDDSFKPVANAAQSGANAGGGNPLAGGGAPAEDLFGDD